MVDHLLYALAWLAFGASHSVLARDNVKARLAPFLGRGYRLAYNLFALLQLGLVYGLGVLLFSEPGGFNHPPWLEITRNVAFGLGVILMIWGLRSYDLGLLSGLKQLGSRTEPEEPLHFDELHHWVRHPLYFAGLLILWGRVGSEFDLATALWASLYLVIGSYFEERQLKRAFGARYEDYCNKVPGLIPWRGRVQLNIS